MWRIWIGWNASHSMGLMLCGGIYGFLAIAQGPFLFQSPFLLIVGLVFLGGFLAVGKVYFFSVPFAGIGMSLASYVASIAASRVDDAHQPR